MFILGVQAKLFSITHVHCCRSRFGSQEKEKNRALLRKIPSLSPSYFRSQYLRSHSLGIHGFVQLYQERIMLPRRQEAKIPNSPGRAIFKFTCCMHSILTSSRLTRRRVYRRGSFFGVLLPSITALTVAGDKSTNRNLYQFTFFSGATQHIFCHVGSLDVLTTKPSFLTMED